MNLTNDNSVGCRQVAACGGLESMAELIVGHFPSFTRSPLFSEMEMPGTCHQKDKHLTDQELDFLVAILGLLVNLVEKDGINRYQTLCCFLFTSYVVNIECTVSIGNLASKSLEGENIVTCCLLCKLGKRLFS